PCWGIAAAGSAGRSCGVPAKPSLRSVFTGCGASAEPSRTPHEGAPLGVGPSRWARMIAAAPLTPPAPAPSYLSISGVEVVFVLLGVIALGAAVACVTSRNVVRAALWLVLSLGGLGGCFLVLTAEFVAVVQVLIYAGAVVVLLLFGLMFTRA